MEYYKAERQDIINAVNAVNAEIIKVVKDDGYVEIHIPGARIFALWDEDDFLDDFYMVYGGNGPYEPPRPSQRNWELEMALKAKWPLFSVSNLIFS